MDRATAYNVLRNGLINLQRRKGQVTVSDLEAEVINNICLALLSQGSQASYIHLIAPYTQAFTEAAALLSEKYRDREAAMAVIGVQQNLAWEGMWDYLRDYYQKNHGIQIDSEVTSSQTFYSTSHKRYEKEILVADTKADRTINLSFIGSRRSDVLISIEPTLSPKKARLLSESNSILKYEGYDPDYRFIVEFGTFDEIEKFVLEMPNRELRIEYYQ